MLDGINVSVATERSTVSIDASLVACAVCAESTLTHYGLTDDEGRAILLLLGSIESLTNLSHVVTIDLDDIPAPSLVLHLCILVHYNATLCRELDVVRIVEHDKVVQTEVTSDTTNTLRDFLLYSTIRNICVNLVLHHSRTQTSLEELLCNSCTSCEGMTLTERT